MLKKISISRIVKNLVHLRPIILKLADTVIDSQNANLDSINHSIDIVRLTFPNLIIQMNSIAVMHLLIMSYSNQYFENVLD